MQGKALKDALKPDCAHCHDAKAEFLTNIYLFSDVIRPGLRVIWLCRGCHDFWEKNNKLPRIMLKNKSTSDRPARTLSQKIKDGDYDMEKDQ